jgi:HD superfamily phosphohydrolase
MSDDSEQGRLIPDEQNESVVPTSASKGKARKAPANSKPTAKPESAHGAADRRAQRSAPPADCPSENGEEARALSKETLLPVSGMVRLSPRELRIIDHPAFQRLFEIYQLGQTYLVYRGATHMRGEHAIGTLHAVMQMAEAVERNAPRKELDRSEHWHCGVALSEQELAFVRLGALLHDIGHLPAGHTFEDELGLLPRHDGDERIEMILDRTDWHGRTYDPMRKLIDELYENEAQGAAQQDSAGRVLSASELLVLLISSDHKNATTTPDTRFRVSVCRDLIGNTICADLIDYLHRDWLHLGKPRYFDPRLLEYLEIFTRHRETVGEEHRLAINLKGTPRPRTDAVTAILDLLESRYQLAEIALFHRVKLAASGMLERVVAEYRDSFPAGERDQALAELLPELLECSDSEMLKLFERKLQERRSGKAERVEGALELVRRLRVRELHRDLHILYEDDIGGPEAAELIAQRFSGDPNLSGEEAAAEVRRAADNRLNALRILEEDFGLDPGSIVMYCPSATMNTKIAEVGIYFKGVVESLAKLDSRNKSISGGHLSAQQERFRRLWRVSFAIDKGAYRRLKQGHMIGPLCKTIESGVLWRPSWQEYMAEDAIREIAETLVQLPESPVHGHTIVAAGMNREQPSVEYPGGAPSVRSCIEPPSKKDERRS